MTNTKYPVLTCRKCGRGFAHVKGYTESREVCGVCLAKRRAKNVKS